MNLEMTQLTKMLFEAFDCGYTGSAELRDEVIADILAKYKVRKEDDIPPPKSTKKYEGFRLYSVIELRELEVDTSFDHATLGECHIAQRGNDKYMAFDNPGLAPSGFTVDGYPWEIPMRMLAE